MNATAISRAVIAIAALVAALPAQQAPSPANSALALANRLIAALAPIDDNPDEIVMQLLEAAIEHRRSPAAAQLTSHAEQLLSDLQDPATLHGWLADHALPDDTHGLLRLRITRIDLALRRRLELPLPSNPFPEFASELVVIGPFGDSGAHWLDVPLPPDAVLPTVGQRLPGRFGEVTARTVRRERDHTAVSLQPVDQQLLGCYYVRWRVHVTDNAAGFLEVGYSGAMSARIDGVEVGRRDPMTAPAAPLQFCSVQLRPGPHDVVIKTGDRSTVGLTLRFVDATGRALAGVTELRPDAAEQPLEVTIDPRDVARFRTGVLEFKQATASHVGAEQTALRTATAWAANRDGEIDRAIELLSQLDEDPPREPLPQLVLGSVLRSCRALPDEQRIARARRLEEQAISKLPAAHYGSRRARVRHLADEDKREDGLRLLRAAVEDGRAGSNTFATMLSTLRRLAFAAEIPDLLERWAAAQPNDPEPHLELSRRAIELQDKNLALQHARRAMAAAPDNRRARQLVYRLAIDLRRFDLAQDIVVRNDPTIDGESPTLGRLRGDIAVAMHSGDTPRLRQLLTEIAQHEDAGPRTHAAIAANLLRLGADDEALIAMDRSLLGSEDQPQLRELRQRLGGTSAPGADFARFRRDGSAVIAAFQPGPAEQGSSTSLCIDQRIVELLADGSAYSEVHELRRINDLRGVEAMRTAEAPAQASELLLLRTVGVDGRSYSPTRVEGSFSMTRLEPGAFVEWRYRQHSGTQLGEPLRIGDFLFASRSEPLHLTEYVLIVPAGMRGELRTRNLDCSVHTETLDDNRRVFVITKRSVARVPVENSPPPAEQSMPIAAFGEDASPWPALRGSRSNQLRRSRPTAPIRRLCDQLLADSQSDVERLRRIHEFCHAEIADGGADDATHVLLRRQGNRLLLTMALLQAADIPFESAACRPWRQQLRSAGDPLFAPDDPAPLPAARVAPRDGTAVWLFADSPRHWPLGAIPAQRSAALAFVIGPFGATQTRLPASDSAVQKLQVDGSCTVTRSSVAAQVTIEIGDTAGYRMIDQLRQSTADARALAARQIGQQIFQDFRMRSAALIDIEPAGTPLRIELELEHTGPQATDQDRWLLSLPLPMAQLRRAFGDRDDRRQPFRLEQDIDFRARIRLHPGDGRVMVDLPPPSLRSFGPLDYQLTFTRDGEAVVIERRLRLRPGTIPVATYPDWIRLLAELDRAEQQKLVLDQR